MFSIVLPRVLPSLVFPHRVDFDLISSREQYESLALFHAYLTTSFSNETIMSLPEEWML